MKYEWPLVAAMVVLAALMIGVATLEHRAEASHDAVTSSTPGEDVAFDMVIDDDGDTTPDNGADFLGAIDYCISVPAGASFTFDVVLDQIPSDDNLVGFSFRISGMGRSLNPLSVTAFSHFAAGVNILTANGSGTVDDARSPSPLDGFVANALDFAGPSGATAESGIRGVMGRYTVSTSGALDGLYGMVLRDVGLFSFAGQDWFDEGFGASGEDSLIDANGGYGIIAVGTACPDPPPIPIPTPTPFPMPPPLPPGATLIVNSTGDSNARDGVLTLREAMELARNDYYNRPDVAELDSGECGQVSNSSFGPPCSTSDTIGYESADTIVFDPTVFPPGAPATIALGSELPDMYATGDSVDGSAAGVIVDGVTKTFRCFKIDVGWGHTIKGLQIYNCSTGVTIAGENGNSVTVEGNVISGNITGMNISGAFNLIKGNLIGTDPTGSFAVPNSRGIYMSGYHAIRNGIVGNVISGNHGDGIGDCWDFEQVIQGNFIGTDITGTRPIPNGGHGIHFLSCGGSRTAVGGVNAGEGNVIAFNGGDGVRQANSDANPVTIRGNSIHSNGGKGIENLGGGNRELPPPVITGVAPLTGTACPNCVIDVYSDDEDEGRVYEGSTTADGSGNWSFGGAVAGPHVTATATDAAGNTSEFSSPAFLVAIDILSFGGRNGTSGRQGLIPVAILSTADFDALREVDRTSLTFGLTGDEDSLVVCRRPGVDVNRDGLPDLTCFFRARATGFPCGDTDGVLRGLTVGGAPIGGRDSVAILRC